jgi:hypothetical protein
MTNTGQLPAMVRLTGLGSMEGNNAPMNWVDALYGKYLNGDALAVSIVINPSSPGGQYCKPY